MRARAGGSSREEIMWGRERPVEMHIRHWWRLAAPPLTSWCRWDAPGSYISPAFSWWRPFVGRLSCSIERKLEHRAGGAARSEMSMPDNSSAATSTQILEIAGLWTSRMPRVTRVEISLSHGRYGGGFRRRKMVMSCLDCPPKYARPL
jgi:hypothetical protein